MIRAPTILLALSAFAGVAWSNPPAANPPAVDADIAAITAQSRAFSRAYERGDVDAMVALYAPDASIVPHGRAAITGTQAIRAFWTLAPGNRVIRHAATPTRIRVDGDHAYDHGEFEASGERDGKPWGPTRGAYVIVWRRGADGTWRMQVDMWNRIAPAP